jgi:hypothetical protein
MPTAADVGFIEMRIAKVVAFGPPLAEERFRCVVLDEVPGDRQLVIQIGETEAFWLGATRSAGTRPRSSGPGGPVVRWPA